MYQKEVFLKVCVSSSKRAYLRTYHQALNPSLSPNRIDMKCTLSPIKTPFLNKTHNTVKGVLLYI